MSFLVTSKEEMTGQENGPAMQIPLGMMNFCLPERRHGDGRKKLARHFPLGFVSVSDRSARLPFPHTSSKWEGSQTKG